MTHVTAVDSEIDSYLARVRVALGGLAEPEIKDIIRELRSHAVELAEGQGVEAAIRSLGDPVDLARTYRAGNSRARANCGSSPLVILQGLRNASRSGIERIAVTALYVSAYAAVVTLWVTALEKLDNLSQTAWWLVPANIAAGVLLRYLADLTARWWIRRYRQQSEIRL